MTDHDPHLFAGRYRLERRLGVGGMSTVQLAFDARLERHVAVKLLAEHLAQDNAFVHRFRREALSAARLVHPNIVQVFDFGLEEETHKHFIVMEYVPGQSMAEVLRERGRLPPSEAVEVLAQACRGLEYAHRGGVVHRDVKPGNLLRSEDGQVKLADFGIAKAAEQSDITKTGSVIGTAAYLAPEQARGEPAGAGADIYALGVVSYQLLAGRLPYDAPSLTELARQQEAGLPPALDELIPEVPHELSEAVDRALAPTPEERYADALAYERAVRTGCAGSRCPTTTAPRRRRCCPSAPSHARAAAQRTGAGRSATGAAAQPAADRGRLRTGRGPRGPLSAGAGLDHHRRRSTAPPSPARPAAAVPGDRAGGDRRRRRRLPRLRRPTLAGAEGGRARRRAAGGGRADRPDPEEHSLAAVWRG